MVGLLCRGQIERNTDIIQSNARKLGIRLKIIEIFSNVGAAILHRHGRYVLVSGQTWCIQSTRPPHANRVVPDLGKHTFERIRSPQKSPAAPPP